MNAKTSACKTRTPAAAAKPKQVSTAAGALRQPAVAPTASQTRKSAATSRAKATARSSSVAPPVPENSTGLSKQVRLISLLQAKPGATIAQMMTLTGWQAHTVRGTISGVLRKKLGLKVICGPSMDSGARLYRIIGVVGRG